MTERPETTEAPEARPRPARATIVATPGVCGGDARVAGTRIPVWLLEQPGSTAPSSRSFS